MLGVVSYHRVDADPHESQYKSIQENNTHYNDFKVFILHDFDAILPDFARSLYFCIWRQFIAFELNFDPLLLEIGQFEITIDFLLLLVECGNDSLNEEI